MLPGSIDGNIDTSNITSFSLYVYIWYTLVSVMAQNDDDDDGDSPKVEAVLKMMEALSTEEREKCAGKIVALCVTDEKVAKNVTKCIQLPNECNKLHKEFEEAGEDTRKKLRSIADDLDWHCRNTSVVQGVGDGATILGSTMVLAGLGSSLLGYNEMGEKLVNAGKTVYNVGFYTSGSANLCQIGIEYWFTYDFEERIIAPYKEKVYDIIWKEQRTESYHYEVEYQYHQISNFI